MTPQELAALEKSLCTNEPVEKNKPSTSVDQNSQTDPGFEDSDIPSQLEKSLEKPNQLSIEVTSLPEESHNNHSPVPSKNSGAQLNKSESKDSGLQSENVSTYGLISPDEEKSTFGDEDRLDDSVGNDVNNTADSIPDQKGLSSNSDIVQESVDNDTYSTEFIENPTSTSLDSCDACENICDICLNIVNDIINSVVEQQSSDSDHSPAISDSSSTNLFSNCDKHTSDADLNKQSAGVGPDIQLSDADVHVAGDKHLPDNDIQPNLRESENLEKSSQNATNDEAQGCRNTSTSNDDEKACSSKSHSNESQNRSRKAYVERKKGAGKETDNQVDIKQPNRVQKGKVSRVTAVQGSTRSQEPRRTRVKYRYNGTISNTFSSVHRSSYDWEDSR